MATWSFLTNHARVLLAIAADPGIRLRDLAALVGVSERRAHGIVTDLAESGYLARQREGRRNRYAIQAHRPLDEALTPGRPIGEVLRRLAAADVPPDLHTDTHADARR